MDFPIAEAVLDSYVGSYVSTDGSGNQITITRPRGFLIADFQQFKDLQDAGRTRLQAVSTSTFNILDNNTVLIGLSAKTVFQQDSTGRTVGLILQAGSGSQAESMSFKKR
jgi:hypothetical protein